MSSAQTAPRAGAVVNAQDSIAGAGVIGSTRVPNVPAGRTVLARMNMQSATRAGWASATFVASLHVLEAIFSL